MKKNSILSEKKFQTKNKVVSFSSSKSTVFLDGSSDVDTPESAELKALMAKRDALKLQLEIRALNKKVGPQKKEFKPSHHPHIAQESANLTTLVTYPAPIVGEGLMQIPDVFMPTSDIPTTREFSGFLGANSAITAGMTCAGAFAGTILSPLVAKIGQGILYLGVSLVKGKNAARSVLSQQIRLPSFPQIAVTSGIAGSIIGLVKGAINGAAFGGPVGGVIGAMVGGMTGLAAGAVGAVLGRFVLKLIMRR